MATLPLFILIFSVSPSIGLNILVYSPKYAYSHMVYLGAVADTLQLAGHNVTVLQPEIITHHKGTGCHHAAVLTVPRSEATAVEANILLSGTFWRDAWVETELWGSTAISPMLRPIFKSSCRDVMLNEELIETLKMGKFALGINEFFDFCGFPLFHEIGLHNVVGASTYVLMDWASLAMGVPLASYIPAAQGVTGDSGSLYERAKNLVYLWHSYQFQNILATAADEVAMERSPSIPSSFDITRTNISFVLTHSHPLLDFPRPTLFGVVDLGGISLKAPKELDSEWIRVLNLRQSNALISFGSIAPSSLMPAEYKRSLVHVFSRFPNHTFIWKYENTDDPVVQGVENLVLSQWLPQNDLLASGKIELFLTHGGSGSIMETSIYGVPAIIVPLFADQVRNARMVERNGIYYCKRDLPDSQLLEETFRKALYDPRVKKAADRVRRLLSKRPFTPQEMLIKTVELAVEVGPGGRLLPAGRNLSWVQYFNLDILALSLLVPFVVLSMLVKCVRGNLREKAKVQ